jgi:hypothetical protein
MDNLRTAEAMIAAYNARNADAYVACMTDDACEALYRGEVLREGKDSVRTFLNTLFADFPENVATVLDKRSLGENVVMRERVFRGEKSDGTSKQTDFEVIAIYSFSGGLCSRVEFIR